MHFYKKLICDIKKVTWFLAPSYLFLSLFTYAPYTRAENNLLLEDATLEEIRAAVNKQTTEWNTMKPALQRLIKSEQDLAQIINALEKNESLATAPSEQQLSDEPFIPVLPKMRKTEQADTKKQVKSTSTKVDATTNQVIEIGIHLASYTKMKHVEQGWTFFKKTFNQELTGKIPFYYQISVNDRLYTRLIAGPFSSTDAAKMICKKIKLKYQYCQVMSYKVFSKNR